MSDHESNFKLPKNIEGYLAALSKLYANEGQKKLQEIIVNAKNRIHEEWSSDNWNGGTYGHALYLVLPEFIYLNAVKQKNELQTKIKEDINKIHNFQNEFIEEVFFEMEVVADQDWRKGSGLLLSGKRVVLPEAINRIWGDEGYRVFLSHKAEVKKEAAALKEKLKLFGISAFVAHEGIHPTKEWQIEIENALSSMDSLVACLTDKFHDSVWTDQEVGFAFGRGIPIISIKLGKDPYGFIGKFQALSCTWDAAAKEIVKILVKHGQMVNAYIKAVQNCQNFENGNTLAEILPFIDKLSYQQGNGLLFAFNDNGQVRASFGFNGEKPRLFGKGLVHHLNRLTDNKYRLLKSGKLEIIP
jgi:hypothetical protein